MQPIAVPRITLEQWRTLQAVVEEDGYAQAAVRLNKSQSAVTYAIQKMEHLLDVPLFQITGRKAVLTPAGQLLYRRAVRLIEDAGLIECAARRLSDGWEPEIRLAVDTVFPTWMLLEVLSEFTAEHPATRIELFETVLGGTEQAIVRDKVDLAISASVPSGYPADPLIGLRFVAVAAPQHPLHTLGRDLTYQDLRRYRQLVIRDSSSTRHLSAGWLGAEQRLTVSHKATAIRAACMGLGFAWYPRDMIRAELARGDLKPLPLREGAERSAELYLVRPEGEYAGPGVCRLASMLHQAVS